MSFGLDEAARRLLRAVAEGAPESVDVATELVGAVLHDATVRKALELKQLIEARSPFALVRAVELAEAVFRTLVPSRSGVGG